MAYLPARRNDLVVRDLGGESVVYDAKTQQVHQLSSDAAAVFAACGTDGQQLTLPTTVIDQALVELRDAGLLAGTSRRTVLVASAVGAGALVATVGLPMAAAHASPSSPGSAPTGGNNAGGLFFVPAGHTLTLTNAQSGPSGDALVFGYRLNQDNSTRVLLGGSPAYPGFGVPQPGPAVTTTLGPFATNVTVETYVFDNTGAPSSDGPAYDNYYFYSDTPTHSTVDSSSSVGTNGPYYVYTRDDGAQGANGDSSHVIGPGTASSNNFQAQITIS